MRLGLSAIEPSADRLGAELIVALRRHGQVATRGLGGERMAATGFERVCPLAPPAMGLWEVLAHLGSIRRQRAALLDHLDGVDALVCIDAPDFHMPVATRARRAGLRTVGWVSPQLWAWRPGRRHAVALAYDTLLCLFDFEPALYAGTGLDARFVGHPAVDRLVKRRAEAGVVAIFPGSRESELSRHLQPFLEATRGYRTVLVAEGSASLRARLRPDPRVHVVSPEEAMARCERALSKSGTVTLELALNGVPAVVAHRVHPLTYAAGRLLVRGIRFLALPNLLSDRAVYREFVQSFSAEALRDALGAAVEPPSAELRARVGPPGVVDRVAAAILTGWG
ncbi:MAG: lipid-A-disaccharide synthase [Deltaproteobacteria bacterium]|nr:lipid-A-disaccharide synthase [Deltaproteobacteria bacterium]MBM4391378.1 lipid-A-disaccharide synthase [Deltaproteobacteria bacterium]